MSCSCDKILHSKLRTQCFGEEEFFPGGLSLEAIYQSSGSSFRVFFVKTTKENEPPFWNHSIAESDPVDTGPLTQQTFRFGPEVLAKDDKNKDATNVNTMSVSFDRG